MAFRFSRLNEALFYQSVYDESNSFYLQFHMSRPLAFKKAIFLVSQGHSFTIVLIFTFEIRGFSLPFLYTRWGLSLRSFCVRPYKSLRSFYRRNKAEKGFGLPALFCRLLSLDGNRSKTVAPSKVFSNVLKK